MVDKQQLIKSLTICINDECDECTYKKFGEYCNIALLHDARELLTTPDSYKPADIVHCKDCKHRPTYWCELHMAWKHDDWFCADGERR